MNSTKCVKLLDFYFGKKRKQVFIWISSILEPDGILCWKKSLLEIDSDATEYAELTHKTPVTKVIAYNSITFGWTVIIYIQLLRVI